MKKITFPSGMKKTKPRVYILDILQEAKAPLSALEIFSYVQEKDDSVWLSTVYRVLDQFVEKNLAEKTLSHSKDTALYQLNRYEHQHYATCLSCHKMIPMTNCPMKDFQADISDPGFQVVGHRLEILGYCSKCSR